MKSLCSFAFDSESNENLLRSKAKKRIKETLADRYFSFDSLDPFYFHTPLFPRVEKWMAVRKKENERKTGRTNDTVHGSITTAPTPSLLSDFAIAFRPVFPPPCPPPAISIIGCPSD